MFTALKQFIFLEKAQSRYAAIKNYDKNTNSWQTNLLAWQILSLLPTNKEKITLAQSLKISTTPASEWALFSYLLQDEHDEEVLCQSILNLATIQNHPLGTKLLHLSNAHKHNSNIISAILEYIRKTGDERLKPFLQSNDIFLHQEKLCPKILDAFLKLKVISPQAKQLCFKVLNGQDTQNSCFYASVFYLFFSAHKEDFLILNQLKNKITNTQHMKIFDLCFSILKPIVEGKETSFFETALFQNEPLFIGYGILNSKLENLTHEFVEKFLKSQEALVTKTILSLRHPQCTEILAQHQFLNKELSESSTQEIIDLWIQFNPIYNKIFAKFIQNPANYFLLFHNKIPLHPGINIQNENWQKFFEDNLKNNIDISMNIIFFQIIALQTIPHPKEEHSIIQNIKKCLKAFNLKKNDNAEEKKEEFIDKIYALCISTNTSAKFIKEIYQFIPFSCTSWAFIAVALTAPKLDIQTLNYAILRELQGIQKALLNENLDKEDYILDVITRFQSIIIGADKFNIQVTKPTLDALKKLANLVQNILDSVEENEELESESNSDWNGQVILDKSILRWNAILQVCLNRFLTTQEIQIYEKLLCQGLKSAPHVEKRWVVRALVHIDSDECIKSILYYALNHIDTDFIERTVYELFSSNHSRSKQALIRAISKNNISDKIKIDIIHHIKNFPTPEIMQELKDLMALRFSENVERAIEEAYIEIAKKK